MRLPLPAAHPVNLRQFLLRCGYASHYNPVANRISFTRRLGRDVYPRFHVYVSKQLDGRTYFNLHLDQKRPSYPGSHAHNAEYDGPVVAVEGERLARVLQAAVQPNPAAAASWRWRWPWSRDSAA